MGEKELDLGRGEVNLYGQLAEGFLIGPVFEIIHRSMIVA